MIHPSIARADTVREFTKILNIEHHISAPHHPEGHGAVERINFDVEQLLRGFVRRTPAWPKLVPAVAFCLNTAASRALGGRSPFEVLHGFKPQSLLAAALRSGGGDGREPDAVGYAKELVDKVQQIRAEVREAQEKLFQTSLDDYHRKGKKGEGFAVGDYILVSFPRANKLDVSWRGPFVVKDKENDLIYVAIDLRNENEFRVHVNRMHKFVAGGRSDSELLAESAAYNEFFIEKVLEHEKRDGQTFFKVKWLGFEEGLPDDPDSWVSYVNSRFTPAVKSYIEKNQLKISYKAEKKIAGKVSKE